MAKFRFLGKLLKIENGNTKMRCLKGLSIVDKDSKLVRYYGKYYFWIDQIPPQYFVPNYCNGQCTAMTGKDANEIYKMAKITKRNNFRIEDIYYTGILRQKANISLGEENNLKNNF